MPSFFPAASIRFLLSFTCRKACSAVTATVISVITSAGTVSEGV